MRMSVDYEYGRDSMNRIGRSALMPTESDEPWYSGGLRFSCTRCGKCCTGEPGFVWVTDEEIDAIAKYRNEPVWELIQLYTRRSKGRRTLREKANGDCIFFESSEGCTIYPVRPPQCRTWPFWESNLATPEDWERTESICPGSGEGELIPSDEITRRLKVIRM
jgi:Fe-S-cluster containining protein